MQVSNNGTSGEAMWNRLVASNGYQYQSIPYNGYAGPRIISIPTANGKITLVNTATDEVYQIPAIAIENNTHVAPYQAQLWQGPNNIVPYKSQIWQVNNNAAQHQAQTAQVPRNTVLVNQFQQQKRYSKYGDSGMLIGEAVPVSMHSGYSMGMYGIPSHDPRFMNPWSRVTSTKLSEGLRIIPANQMQQFSDPDTPTKYEADALFNDALYMSLQGDLKPEGASQLDDYLNQHAQTRLNMYKRAVLGEQECPCQCERSDFDAYLYEHRDLETAMLLRATLSDDLKHRIQEPRATKPVEAKLEILRGQASNILKWLSKYSESSNITKGSVLDVYDEDEGIMII